MNNSIVDRRMEKGPVHWWHLTKRFFGSLSNREPAPHDTEWAHQWLLPAETALWDRMCVEDRRHTIRVGQAYFTARPLAQRDEIAAALLHDIGKIRSRLGTVGRVMAKLVGPRTEQFRVYHDHEEIGAEMLRTAGSSLTTIAMIDGSCDDPSLLAALLAADNA
jgi:putative nucleotidyltransferase with HDIG domain